MDMVPSYLISTSMIAIQMAHLKLTWQPQDTEKSDLILISMPAEKFA